jgi:hypothetical protein
MKNPMHLGIFSTENTASDLNIVEAEMAGGDDFDSCQNEEEHCSFCNALLVTSVDDHGKEDTWCPSCGEH